MRIRQTELLSTAKHLYAEMKQDDVTGAAAELAFRLFLAVFPFFIFLAALGGFISDALNTRNPADEIMGVFGNQLPPDTESVLRGELDQVIERRDPALLSVGVIGALWAAAGGVGTIMKAGNRAYDVKESRPFLLRLALSVALTALAGLLLVGAFIITVAGQVFGLEVAEQLGLEGLAARLLTFLRWPLVVLLTLVATAFLYWLAPCKTLPLRWITPGAAFFLAGWLVASFGFSLYVAHLGSYNATYGALGGVVVTLVWLWLTSLILLTGLEVNALLARQAGPVDEPAMVAPEESPADATAAPPRAGFQI